MEVTYRTRAQPASFSTRADGGARTIEGYFSVFNSPYELWPGAVEIIAPGAFDGVLDDDIRALADHDTRVVLGRVKAGTLTLRVDDKGLHGTVSINEADQEAVNLYARVQRGDVDQASFGFEVEDEDMVETSDGGVQFVIRKLRKLYEVSVVTFPAYPATQLEARRADWEQARARRLQLRKEHIKSKLEGLQC